MSATLTTEWLKTSVPGIIMLGAVGSILAVLIIKICRRLLSASADRVDRFLMSYFRPYAVNKSLAEDYLKRKDKSKLVIFCIITFSGFVISCITLLFFGGISVLYFFTAGLRLSFGGFACTTLTLLAFFAWLRDAFAAAAVYEVVFRSDFSQVARRFKSPDSVWSSLEDGERKVLAEKQSESSKDVQHSARL